MLPSPDILNDYPFGKFVLSNLAAKRAKQLKAGAPPLVPIESNHPLTIALAEIAAGKIRPILKDPGQIEADDTPEAIITDEFGILLPGIEDEEDVLAIEGLAEDSLLEEFGADEEEHEAEDETDRAPTLSDLVADEEDEHEAEATVVEPEVDGTLSLSDLEEDEEPADEDDELSE